MSRPDRDTFWFNLAAQYATMATCPRAAIGCVIVNPTTHRQVGAGYNGAPTGQAHCIDVGCLMIPGADHCLRAIHSEVNAANQVTPGLRNLVAYVVGGREVCSHCARELYAVGVREIQYRESAPSLDALARDIRAWQAETFPQGAPASVAEHLLREARELAERPTSWEEIADIFHLLIAAAEVNDYDLAALGAQKFSINRQRVWSEPDAAGVVEHVRTDYPGAIQWNEAQEASR